LIQEHSKPKDTFITYEEGLKESTIFREKFPNWVEGGVSLAVKQVI